MLDQWFNTELKNILEESVGNGKWGCYVKLSPDVKARFTILWHKGGVHIPLIQHCTYGGQSSNLFDEIIANGAKIWFAKISCHMVLRCNIINIIGYGFPFLWKWLRKHEWVNSWSQLYCGSLPRGYNAYSLLSVLSKFFQHEVNVYVPDFLPSCCQAWGW